MAHSTSSVHAWMAKTRWSIKSNWFNRLCCKVGIHKYTTWNQKGKKQVLGCVYCWKEPKRK